MKAPTREDILLKPLAEELGYTVDVKGDVYENGTLKICRGHGYVFEKGNRVIWGVRFGYTCADLVPNEDGCRYYRNHRSYTDLEAALYIEAGEVDPGVAIDMAEYRLAER